VRKGYAESLNKKAIRERQIREVGYECGACPSRVALQLHHKTYKRLGAELVEDLEWLCNKCHKEAHKIGVPKTKVRPKGPTRQSANKKSKKQRRQESYALSKTYVMGRLPGTREELTGKLTGSAKRQAVSAIDDLNRTGHIIKIGNTWHKKLKMCNTR
jgi:hypothetical protein